MRLPLILAGHLLVAGTLAALPGSAQAGELYRWVDKSGKVHYSDTPAPDAAEVKKKKFGTSPATGDEGLSFEMRRAKQHFPVTLYVTDNCTDPCKQARDLLTQRGVPYSEKNLANQEEIDAFKRTSGADAVPVLSVGRNWLKGFQPVQWQNELDAAGYPKAAPRRPPAPAKSSAARPGLDKPAAAK